MPLGPGKYDAELTALMRRYHFEVGVLIVAGGERGNCFTVQVAARTPLEATSALRSTVISLRAVALAMEADIARIEAEARND